MPRRNKHKLAARAAAAAASTASSSGGWSSDSSTGADRSGASAAAAAARRRLLQRHNDMLRDVVSMCADAHRYSSMMVTLPAASKTAGSGGHAATAARLRSLLPIDVQSLVAGATHRRRALRGRLLVDACTMQAAMTVMEDEHGHACRVAVYNLPAVERAQAAGQGQWAAVQAGQRALPKGAWLTVIEPFFKRATDGELMVRVDDPSEIVVDMERPADAPTSGAIASAEWVALKEEGNRMFAGGLVDEAVALFGRALQCDAHVLSSVASNVALCELQQNGDPVASLRAALIAVAADAKSPKMWMRAAVALEELTKDVKNNSTTATPTKAAAAALWCAEHAAQLATGSQSAEVAAAANALAQRIVAKHSRAELTQLIPNREAGHDAAAQTLVTLACNGSTAAAPAAATSASSASASVSSPSDSAVADNKKGGELYKAGSRAEAFECFQRALRQLSPRAVLLSNRALVLLKLSGGRAAESLMDATTAALLDPHCLKAYYRQAEALLALGAAEDAAAACQRGLDQCTAADDVLRGSLEEMRRRAASAAAAQSSSASFGAAASSTPANQFPSEEEQRSRNDLLRGGEVADGAQQAMMNQMMEMMQRMAGLKGKSKKMPKLLDERVVPFHTEYSNAGYWPRDVDVASARDKIASAYEIARAVPLHEATMCMDDQRAFGKILESSAIKRLGAADKATIRWWTDGEFGDVRFLREHLSDAVMQDQRQAGYHEGCHSFSNDISVPQMLTLGTTHVAVGFVDLGVLRTATLAGDHQVDGPLRFVGYDQSAPCVAKTIVLARMMTANELSVSSSSSSSSPPSAISVNDPLVTAVLECWYSASWRPATVALFRRTLTLVLEEHASGAHPQPAAVLSLLLHWQRASVSLAAARAQWLRTSKEPVDAANFRLAADRSAYLSYCLSGDVLPAQADSVASVLMFALPHGVTRAADESIFDVVPMTELLQRRAHTPDIVAAAMSYLRAGIAQLCCRVRFGAMTIEVRLGRVELGSAVVDAISSLRPYTISWSNVLDYMRPRDFWQLARACSAPADTIHFASSMNWVMSTHGSCLLDFFEVEKRRQFVQMANEEIKDLLRSDRNAQRLLLIPPVDNVLNIAGYVLAHGVQRRWIQAFTAPHRAGAHQLATVTSHMFNFLARQSTALSLTFTFDMDMKFQGTEYRS